MHIDILGILNAIWLPVLLVDIALMIVQGRISFREAREEIKRGESL